MKEALRFEHISKTFGSVKANNDVSFSVERGKIYSILGENGSGKTSLMNVVAGIYKQDGGKVYVNGEEAFISSPRDAFRYRIGMIHQHFKLVDRFTAAENVVLGLTKEDYKEYNLEQEEKLIAKQNEYGTIKYLKSKIKETKFEIKNLSKEGKEIPQYLNENLEKYKTNLVKIKNYTRYAKRSKGFNLDGASERIENIANKYGFEIKTNKHVHDMSVSEKQELEILKALYRGVDILILDEPTAVLTPQEIRHLFDALKNMKKSGKTVIIITHKLNEVMEISDKVVVLRKGEYIGEIETKNANEKMLAEMMIGKKIDLNINRSKVRNTPDRLIIENLTIKNADGNLAIDNISFTARSGEILGIAGISGSGQKELLEGISGLRNIKDGKITFINPKENVPVTLFHKTIPQIRALAEKGTFHDPKGLTVNLTGKKNKEIAQLIKENKIIFNNDEIIDLRDKNPLEIRELGIHLSFVPEDRLGMGLVGNMDLTDNMMLRTYRKGKTPLLNRKNPTHLAEEIVNELEVSTPNVHTPVKQLSGGNIQKVLVGREIAFAPKVLMAAYPVRGLDINSSYMIYKLLDEQKKKGVSVIYAGEDLDVILALCDRVLVLNHGKIAAIVDPRKVTKDEIGLLMTKELL